MILQTGFKSCNYGPWKALYRRIDHSRSGIIFVTDKCQYLFLLMDAGRDVRIAMIEDKLRACVNLEHENWSIIGRVYELSTKWLDEEHPAIGEVFRRLKHSEGNYYLLKSENDTKGD